MSTIEELEAAVERLSPEDRAAFRAWFAEFDAAEWDRQLEADAASGRLDWERERKGDAAQFREHRQDGNS